jgi:hypothetical protein
MKAVLNKKTKEPKQQEFIVLNEYCQVFCGLRRGYPSFSDDMNEARTIVNDAQFRIIQQGTSFKLEKLLFEEE